MSDETADSLEPRYPWVSLMRISVDDPSFCETLVTCLQSSTYSEAECTGFCTGRCQEKTENVVVQYTVGSPGIRTMGPSATSRLFRHRLRCGAIPAFIYPRVVDKEDDTLCLKFATHRGLTAFWSDGDRKLWFLYGAPGAYRWTYKRDDTMTPVATKQIFHWRLTSEYVKHTDHPLTLMCNRWNEGPFVNAVAHLWETMKLKSTLSDSTNNDAKVSWYCDTLLSVLQTHFGVAHTAQLTAQLRRWVSWVIGQAPDDEPTDHIRRVLTKIQWSPLQLSTTLCTSLLQEEHAEALASSTPDKSNHSRNRKGRISIARMVKWATTHGLLNESDCRYLASITDIFATIQDSREPTHFDSVLLRIHLHCIMCATKNNPGYSLPLRKHILCQPDTLVQGYAKQSVVYYELSRDWNTGVGSLDKALWATLVYVAPQQSSSGSTKRYRGGVQTLMVRPGTKRTARYRLPLVLATTTKSLATLSVD